MWMEKLAGGVLRVLTPLGPRYVEPNFLQRVYLLWIFRHFEVLPLQVLNRWQRRLIDTLCAEQRFVKINPLRHLDDVVILGTVERRPPVEVETLPERKPAARAEAVAPMAVERPRY